MHLRTWIAAFAAALLLGGLAGCGEPSPELKKVGDKMSETWEAMKAYGVKKREAFEAWSAKRLEDVKEAYEKAAAKGTEVGGQASAELKAQWAVVQEKMLSLQAASAEEWESARDAFAQAYDSLMKEIEALR